MHKGRSLIWCTIFCLGFAPRAANAQVEETEDFVKDVLLAVFGPHPSIFVHGGATNHGRFLLQRVPLGTGATGERALHAQDGYAFGGGIAIDILLRMGMRIDYSYGSADLALRTDNGSDSEELDVDDFGQLKSHTLSVEVMRYLLPSRVAITPYASVGFSGSWYSVSDAAPDIVDAETQFRMGGLASLGLKVRLQKRLDMRLEGTTANMHNPFTGRESYGLLGGTTVDEPTRVRKHDYRIALTYKFGGTDVSLPRAAARLKPK